MSVVKRLLIIDDHPVSREGTAAMAGMDPELEVCGMAGNYEDALQCIEDLKPDLVVLDLSLKDNLDGLKILQEVFGNIERPELKVIVLSMYEEEYFAERVLKAGAMGYVMKNETLDYILNSFKKVLAGKVAVSEKVSDLILKKMSRVKNPELEDLQENMTDSEMEILLYLGKGYRPKEIADMLNLSIKTVENLCRRLRAKTGTDTLSELVRYAIHWRTSQ